MASTPVPTFFSLDPQKGTARQSSWIPLGTSTRLCPYQPRVPLWYVSSGGINETETFWPPSLNSLPGEIRQTLCYMPGGR